MDAVAPPSALRRTRHVVDRVGDTALYVEPGKEKEGEAIAQQMKKIAEQKFRPPQYNKAKKKRELGGPPIPKQAN